MGRRVEVEAVEISVFGAERQNKVGRTVESLVERFPRVLALPFVYRFVRPSEVAVIPRPAGVHGALVDPQEVSDVRQVAERLRGAMTRRQPALAELDDPHFIQIKRVRVASFGDYYGRRHIRHGDVTHDYLGRTRTSSINSMTSNAHDQDADVRQNAVGLSQELAGRGIRASDNAVRRLIHRRADVIEQYLAPDWRERVLGIPALLLAARLRKITERAKNYNLNADAEQFAGDGLRYATVSGSQPEVGLGGVLLGFGELLTDQFARVWGKPRSDAIAQWYIDRRYKPQRVFGDRVDYHGMNQMIGWLGQTSRLPKLWNLWAMQMVGRQELRTNMYDQATRGEIVRAATLGVRNDFYQYNRDLA